MTDPVIWMPTLDVRDMPETYVPWAVERFLRRHQGRGHIICHTAGPWPSFETDRLSKDAHWYLDRPRKAPKRGRPADVTVDMQVPLGSDDPILELLEIAQQTAPLNRLIVRRPAGGQLSRIVVSLKTLKELLGVPIWLDVRSFGWTAVSYLMARDPWLQAFGVDDAELWCLIRLAEVVNRPAVLADLSGRPAMALSQLSPHDDSQALSSLVKSLPSRAGSR